MGERKDWQRDLAQAFARVKRSGKATRYDDKLKRLVLAALGAGVRPADVRRATGISSNALNRWAALPDDARHAGKSHKAKTRGARFKRLKVVDGPVSPPLVSMFVGQDIRLDLPAAMLSADLIKRLTGGSSS